MGRSGIKIEGLEALADGLAKRIDRQDIRKAVSYHTAEMQLTAQMVVPVDTGTLKRSIKSQLIDGGMTGEVEPHTDYAAYVEYGTRFQEAQPYMQPAFMQQSARFKADLEKMAR